MAEPVMYDWEARRKRYEAGGQRGGIQGGLSGIDPMGNRVDYSSAVDLEDATYDQNVPAYRQVIQKQKNLEAADKYGGWGGFNFMPPPQSGGPMGGGQQQMPFNPFTALMSIFGGGGQMQSTTPPPKPDVYEGAQGNTPGETDQTVKIQIEAPNMNGQQQMATQPMPPQQQMAPYPTPNPQVQPPPSPYSPFQGPSPVPPATPAPALPGPPGAGAPGAGQRPADPGAAGPWGPWEPSEKNVYGGQQIAGADPSMGDYESVQTYADQAMENANRWLEPQQAEQNRRMQQELINKGVDPNSAVGQEMQNRLAMQQADARSKAMFDSLGFGQGIQQQMAQQELAKSGLAGDMQKALWQAQLGSSGQDLQRYLGGLDYQLGRAGLANQFKLGQMAQQAQRYGQDLDYMLGRSGQDLQRYGMDLSNQLGLGQLDLARQGQDFGQMKDLWGMERQTGQDQWQRDVYQDQMLMKMLGMDSPGAAVPIDPSGFAGSLLGSAGGNTGFLGKLFG